MSNYTVNQIVMVDIDHPFNYGLGVIGSIEGDNFVITDFEEKFVRVCKMNQISRVDYLRAVESAIRKIGGSLETVPDSEYGHLYVAHTPGYQFKGVSYHKSHSPQILLWKLMRLTSVPINPFEVDIVKK